ncbi:MAG: hypothetical protein IT210_12910 [Armatimonadetes bacterium]|nr:hypothetical protein [Armatimonadota bacterium]
MKPTFARWLYLGIAWMLAVPAQAVAQETTVPKGTKIPLRFASKVSSKTSKVGEKVYFTIANDVFVGNALVIKKGDRATGSIKSVKRPGRFGQSARIQIDLNSVRAVDGSEVPIQQITKTKKQGETTAAAGAASIGGGLILGPIGVIGGMFVRGRHVQVDIGAPIDVEVKTDSRVKGTVQP